MVDILYEDNHLFVVNKATGILTQPSGTVQDSLEAQCKEWIKQHYQKPGQVFLHAIHRIDKVSSGIVVFAKTSKALSRLNDKMRKKDSQKYYKAIVEGKLKNDEGCLEHYLIHGDYQALQSSKENPEAKFCKLYYHVLKNNKTLSFLDIQLDTGRYHQIRAQLSIEGYPIIGDYKYGSQVKLPADAIALHHYRFQIEHPVKDQMMIFEAPEPPFWKLFDK